MNLSEIITLAGIAMLGVGVYGNFVVQKENDLCEEKITKQSETIDSLKTALQTSNEKRGRLFLALLYTDIKGKEKQLDSLLIEIGKDN